MGPVRSAGSKTWDPFKCGKIEQVQSPGKLSTSVKGMKMRATFVGLALILPLIGLKTYLFWLVRPCCEEKQKSKRIYTLPCAFFVAGYSCGGLRTQVAGVISSSNFPYYYKSNTSCVWKISVNTANQITLNFTDFELENSSRCEHAYVQVFDGPNTTDPSLGIFCGSKIPTGVRSSGNQMLVVFHAYSGNNFKGFRAYYDSGKLIRRIFFRWLMTLEVDNWRNILSITICSFSKWLRQPEGLQIHLHINRSDVDRQIQTPIFRRLQSSFVRRQWRWGLLCFSFHLQRKALPWVHWGGCWQRCLGRPLVFCHGQLWSRQEERTLRLREWWIIFFYFLCSHFRSYQ